MWLQQLAEEFFGMKATTKTLIGVLSAVVSAAISISAAPNAASALVFFLLFLSIGGVFYLMDLRFREVRELHDDCQRQNREFIKAVLQNGHTGKKRRAVDKLIHDLLGEGA